MPLAMSPDRRLGVVPQETRKPEVHIHTANFMPWTAFVGNRSLVDWVEKSGGDKMEWIAAGPILKGIPIGPTHEVLVKPVSALRQIFAEKLGNGHQAFHPLVDFSGIMLRKEDPLEGGAISPMYGILATEATSARALEKLTEVKRGDFPIVVNPPVHGTEYFDAKIPPKRRYLQMCPAIFNDGRTPEEIISAVKNGVYGGVVFDTYHAGGETKRGFRPVGPEENALFTAVEKFHQAGVLKEVHFQPGRVMTADASSDRASELNTILRENPHYDTLQGRLLRFMINDLEFRGPYTTEIDPRALGKVLGNDIWLRPPGNKMFNAQAAVVDYIRRAA